MAIIKVFLALAAVSSILLHASCLSIRSSWSKVGFNQRECQPSILISRQNSIRLDSFNEKNLDSNNIALKERICTVKAKSIMKKIALFSFAALPAAIFGFNQIASASSLVESFAGISKTASESGFVQSFLLIFISEIGDKTFFIAGLLAAKYGKLISFVGSMSALGIMTIISTVLGQIFHAVPTSISRGIPFDDYIAVAAFSYFGLKTLIDASQLSGDDNTGIEEEKEEAEKSVAEITKRNSFIALFIQIFSLVFAAEIGDRSFLSTIALSAALNPFAVATGALVAHGSATGVAVLGGELLSKYLSEKIIGYIGGSLFIIFAATTAFGLF